MPIRVLVVDDSASIRALLTTSLTDDHVSVSWQAAGVVEAMEIAVRVHPDAIVLDQQMPDGLGTEILPRLRELLPHARIVFFSSDIEIRRRALDLGADGYVGKGEPLDRLADLLIGEGPATALAG